MCDICNDTFIDCPVCNTRDDPGVETQELIPLRGSKFVNIKDSLGFRFKYYKGTVTCVNWKEYQSWRNRFIKQYGDATLCIDRTTFSSGYNECNFYVWNDNYLQEKRDYHHQQYLNMQKINQFLGL